MALLTTSKLIGCAGLLKAAINAKGPARMLEEIEADPTLNELYNATTSGKDYKGYGEASFETIETRLKRSGGSGELPWLLPTAEFGLVKREAYYLLQYFRSSLDETERYHIRFENPGEAEIDSFHLTSEDNPGGLKRDKTSLYMRGRLFFKVDGGRIVFVDKNRIRGSGDDQYSDVRLSAYVLDVLIYMYYFMYKIRDHS